MCLVLHYAGVVLHISKIMLKQDALPLCDIIGANLSEPHTSIGVSLSEPHTRDCIVEVCLQHTCLLAAIYLNAHLNRS